MSRLYISERRLRVFNEALVELYRNEHVGLPAEAIIRAVNTIAPHTWTSIDELRLADGQVIHHDGQNLESFAHLVEAQRHFGTDNPNVRYFIENNGSTEVIKWSDLISPVRLRDTAYYQEVIRGVGVKDQVAVVTKLPTGSVGIALCAEHDFTEEDRLLLSLLQPHVSTVVQQGLRYRFLASSAPLTAREQQVLHWLAQGKRDEEIGKILGISKRTVELHVHRVLVKLEVETRTAAAAVAWRSRMDGEGPPEAL